jgi:hypothetical protein
VADLGSSYVYSDAYLYGLAASFKPASFLEIGIEHQITVGGKGRRKSVWRLVKRILHLRGDIYAETWRIIASASTSRPDPPTAPRRDLWRRCFEDLGESHSGSVYAADGISSGLLFPAADIGWLE